MHCDTDIRVRYAETDQMGVVYHGSYFPWFEEARTDLLQAMGYSYRVLEEQGLMFPLVECSCRFRAPARYADRLTVRSRLIEVKGVQFTIAYEVYRQPDMSLLAEGSTRHVFVGRDFKPVNMMRFRPDVYEKMKESVSEAPHLG